jgi:hypothetical protein
MTWELTAFESGDGNYVKHLIPVADLREHTLSADCWCIPDLDEEYWIAAHHSADNREAFETGERKVS